MIFNIFSTPSTLSRPSEPTAVTVGVFDGVHRGHRDLIDQLRRQQPEMKRAVVTLTAHPSFVLGRREKELWLDEPLHHREMLFEAGADYVAELSFTEETSRLTACQMAQMMQEELCMKHLLTGYDSRFGSKQADDFPQLAAFGKERGFSVAAGEKYLYRGIGVSSSAIRQALEEGSVDQAADLLGYQYTLFGTVEHGRGVGHTIGFPTANVDLGHSRMMLPKEGVYAVRLNGRPAVANLGTAPTYGIESRTLEVHVLHFEADLYDREVAVQFVHRLRQTKTFLTVEQLRRQIEEDIKNARQWL